jgi:type IV fimbrial biogenesis protein FimT
MFDPGRACRMRATGRPSRLAGQLNPARLPAGSTYRREHMSLQQSRRHQVGFTLVELMITLAVVAVLVGIGFPSFNASMRSSRVTTQANAMLSAVNLARSEAIKTNQSAAICPTPDPTLGAHAVCGGTFATGWLVFDDTNGNGALDAGETVVRVFPGNTSVTMTANAALITPIAFNNQALPTTTLPATGVASIVITPIDCPHGVDAVRNIFINSTGQLRIQNGNCP